MVTNHLLIYAYQIYFSSLVLLIIDSRILCMDFTPLYSPCFKLTFYETLVQPEPSFIFLFFSISCF